MGARRATVRALAVGAVLALGAGAARPEEAPPVDPRVVLGAGATREDAALVCPALASFVVLATAPEGARPAPEAAEACGVVAGRGDVVLTTWHYLRRVAGAPRGTTLWARGLDAGWEPVSPLGRAWWVEAGVALFVLPRKDRIPLPLAEAPTVPRGRGLALLPAPGGRVEIATAPLLAVESCDPTAPGGRAVSRRGGVTRTPGAGSFPVLLRYGASMRGRVVEGAPVLDEEGHCIGIAQRVEPTRADPEVVVRPASLLRPWVDQIRAAGGFDPMSLGVRLVPGPVPAGTDPTIPSDLALAREEAKTGAGAAVIHVDPRGPGAGLLWLGDVVLEVEGRAVVPEVYESLGAAWAALQPGGPAEVAVWRGGKRERVTVTPRRASSLDSEAVAREEALGAAILPR